MTFAGVVALLVALKPVLIPLLTGLVGWLLPSPIKQKQSAEQSIVDAIAQGEKTGRPG